MSDYYGYPHLSVGDLLRSEQSDPSSPHAALISEYIREGKLMPSSRTMSVINRRMSSLLSQSACGSHPCIRRFIVDGFPRKIQNMEAWLDTFGGKLNPNDDQAKCPIFAVIVYECSLSTLTSRILSRGSTSGRTDDHIQSAKKRFETFSRETEPVIEKLEGMEDVRVLRIDGEEAVEEVWKSTKDAIDGLRAEEVIKANLRIEAAAAAAAAAPNGKGPPGVRFGVDKRISADFEKGMKERARSGPNTVDIQWKANNVALLEFQRVGARRLRDVRVFEERCGEWVLVHFSLS